MKTMLAAFAFLTTQLCSAAELTVQIDDVKSADGMLMLALYDAQSFLKKPVKAARAAAVPGGTTVVFKDLPEGEYAFALFHDANGNGKMDKNPIGIPTEDYAFSNNALGTMGPPGFDKARIVVTAAGTSTRVSLK
ncbi:DUF2141 domain-containing protein [Massilia sp. PAMC28688]|uniref:DUF2141 domain-containing protein n=1 Tax=Massilia sp. PAMC28688 TaxID=2861283 RepID=UPI001C634252|nr:DUF2141 domain-containing protein [Massilia sp. PAMC28688]QYF93394.1 DUF2141 domain-containing protein [Massilia sp. PAMC28688]